MNINKTLDSMLGRIILIELDSMNTIVSVLLILTFIYVLIFLYEDMKTRGYIK